MISSWRVCIQVFWCIFSFWMLIQWGIVEQSLWVILQFVIKAWNFKNFIIVSQVTIFLTEILCTATWVLKSAFFLWLQIFFLQTMSNYVPFEPQFNGDQSFLRNYGQQMYGLRDTEDQNPLWHHHFSEGFFFVFRNMSAYTKLESKFNADQKFLASKIQWVKVHDDVIVSLLNVSVAVI